MPSKVDSLRERELYRYFKPPESPTAFGSDGAEEDGKVQDDAPSAPPISSPDTTLTALSQLVIDSHQQYFLAEATKTLNIANTSKYEKDGDALWAGCSTVDKSGRLCEKTIELPASLLGRKPCFTVNDLSKDERFKSLPFVTGYPYFKFYVGAPLTTKKGINIGSLFILDDKARPHLTEDEEEFLGSMAQIVMKHFETASEAEERRKVMRMSTGLSSFVEGRSHFPFNGDRPDGLSGDRFKHGSKSGIKQPAGSPIRRSMSSGKPRLYPSPSNRSPDTVHRQSQNSRVDTTGISLAEVQEKIEPTQKGAGRVGSSERSAESDDGSYGDTDVGPASVDAGHRATCARAANLLSESFDLSGPHRRGGVVFFDTTSRMHRPGRKTVNSIDQQDSEWMPSTDLDIRPAEIVSQSARDGAFTPLDQDLLFSFLKRYPRGKLWSFDLDGSLSSSEDDNMFSPKNGRHSKNDTSRAKRRQIEANILQRHFPKCRQLLFTGLWDAAASRWFLGGFAWTVSSRQVFSVDTELNFFKAFGNSVMAEVSRLASMAADRQKADFIGSISHELRSPLHGILASAEFLSETEADAFQTSLVDTISSCGRTLLDTINHILDYSKINSFERTWRGVRRLGTKRGAGQYRITTRQGQPPPMLSIYEHTNVAFITEEVVEGVYAGQIYQDISSTEATDFSHSAKAEAKPQTLPTDGQSRISKASAQKAVDVILDIENEDYTFVTQPGALRRVVMNILGNALKYTQRGSIWVKLRLDPVETTNGVSDVSQERILQIKVVDTGKGISKEYLRTSLFNPFCQEDVLASGTGLGLSIVKSIANMLNGTVEIESEVGVGTEVTVRVPLSRIPGTDTPVSTPSSVLTNQAPDDSIACLIADYASSTVALYGFEHALGDTGRVVKAYFTDWYELKTIPGLPKNGPKDVDLVILDEKALSTYQNEQAVDVPMLVLCATGTKHSFTTSRLNYSTVIEYVSKPFGPYKLAKGVRACLDRSRTINRGAQPSSSFPMKRKASEGSDSTHIPEMSNLTLETNDALAPIEVQTNGIVTAVATENAQMAMAPNNSSSTLSSHPTSGDLTVTNGQDFPFPSQSDKEESWKAEDAPQPLIHDRPQLAVRATAPLVKTLPPVPPVGSSQAEVAATMGYQAPNDIQIAKELLHSTGSKSDRLTASNVALLNGQSLPETSQPPQPLAHEERPPRLLLVDDNQINLRLLQTFMKRRKYTYVDSAENGQLAVQAAASQEYGYDIIFMDISMPVMNGFEATRAIRDIEDEARAKQGEGESRPALIIALTGLASDRDQTEAFTSGVDLFMTKPVSFKEVGKLLDNWEDHGGPRGIAEKDEHGEQ